MRRIPFLSYDITCFLLLSGFLLLMACRSEKSDAPIAQEPERTRDVQAHFTLMSPKETGVNFVNHMREDYNYNNFIFEYMYNGGGVAVGDVNGDKLPDLYFSSSRFSNKLYINKGNFKFVDVTAVCGVGAEVGFKTGVAMADVNGDGRLDLYSCRTSKTDDAMKSDHLFINLGVRMDPSGMAIPVFEDQAKKMGIDDNSDSNHACFFDYDNDGDLDMYLVNHKVGFTEANKLRVKQEEDGSTSRYTAPETPFESDRMYRNDTGVFTDVTAQAGVVSSAYGLSVTAADFNHDGWMDLYVANDYVEPDFIYINNKDGTFTDRFSSYLRHTAHSSMGVDISDFNNDGLIDIMVLEMKAEDPFRYKELMNIMLYDRYNMMVEHGYGRQVGRNVLQLNNGNGTFSEIGQYAGVDATDWSWGVLMADFDNDGWKDMYISNGYRKDVTQLDYLNYFRDSLSRAGGLTAERYPNIDEFLKFLPEKKLSNYLYLNNRDLTFHNASKAAGLDLPSFSNGAAYADLDQDGDLDIIVNNIDDAAFIYRNDVQGQNWLQIDLQGPKGNTDAIGAFATLYAGNQMQYQMMMASKGIFSTSEPILHFGLGSVSMVDSILMQWPDGKIEKVTSVPANQRMIWKAGTGATIKRVTQTSDNKLFAKNTSSIAWRHAEDDFVDVKRERLIPYMLSAEGPCLAIGDVNGDSLEDLYAGNGKDFPSTIFTQSANGRFVELKVPAFQTDAAYEDCGAVFQDFDHDQDLDLIVISGGNALPPNDPGYVSRYYVNDGKGGFTRDGQFPLIQTNAGTVLAFDYDQDQDMDVLIGGRCVPGMFPTPPPSFLLRNDGGKFKDVTSEVFGAFKNIGMLTDMEHGDLDGDGKDELLLVGDWMPLRIFAFDGNKFMETSSSYGLENANGWWKSIQLYDMDKDGDLDVVAGNMGLNHRLHTSARHPITLVSKDFDGNGSIDPIMCYYYQGQLYPFAQRDAIIGQIPVLKKKFTRYNPYAHATVEQVFSKSELKESAYLYAHTFSTTLYKNENNKLVPVELPAEAQLHPVFDMVIEDFNGDGRPDLLLAGNFLYSETETGEMDAGNGTLLLQKEDGSFAYMPNRYHGFWAQGEVRELKMIRLSDGKEAILTGNNKGAIEFHQTSVSHSSK